MPKTHTTNTCELLKQKAKTRRFSGMWIVDNSIKVLDNLRKFNEKKIAKNIRTYDFSTLYTSIPHKDLKREIAWVVSQCFNKDARRFIRVNTRTGEAHWSKTRGNKDHVWNKDELIIVWLIDYIYVVCGDSLFKQVIGIPMGTDCAPFLANLFLFAFESKWMSKKHEENDFETLRSFDHCFRYILY